MLIYWFYNSLTVSHVDYCASTITPQGNSLLHPALLSDGRTDINMHTSVFYTENHFSCVG